MAGHTPKAGGAAHHVERTLRRGVAVTRGSACLVVMGQPAMLGVGDDRASVRENDLKAGAPRGLVEDAGDPACVARVVIELVAEPQIAHRGPTVRRWEWGLDI